MVERPETADLGSGTRHLRVDMSSEGLVARGGGADYGSYFLR